MLLPHAHLIQHVSSVQQLCKVVLSIPLAGKQTGSVTGNSMFSAVSRWINGLTARPRRV